MELSFDELVLAVKGEILVDNENRNFNNVNTDTRKIEKDNVFIALKGENFNGNIYAKDALEKGASIAIIDE
ncbi:MAG: Mur ligase domain-containing protein, partial [Clostridium paraputrificum]